ncbi:MAG: META domain-containing protein, partial [Muribaculaceae bacterium]|nr:META domain-containing protein [Muribaculaceae bacterium]
VLSTMKLCPDDRYGDLINSVINDNSRLVAECRRIGQDTYLSLMDSAGKTKMTLRRHNMEFLNGNWQITAIDGKEINDPEANIFFDIAELKVHGNTGCNYFNGDLYIDPMRSNAIDLSNMGTTRMACPKTSQETAMLAALESAASAIAGTAEGTALLLDSSGKQVLTLKRIPTQDE